MEVRQHKHNTHALSSTRGSPSRSVGRPKRPTHAPHTPHTSPTQAIASALTPKFYSISTLPFSFLFLDTNRTTSFSFV